MPRKKKYQTDEERIQAKRASARKSYHKRKQEKVVDEEFERLMRLNPDLYTSKKRMTDEQKSFIKSLMNMPLDVKPSIKRATRQTNSNAKQQLGLATSKINKHKSIKTIDFDLDLLKSEQERNYFFEHLSDVIYRLLDRINFNTEHWTVYYRYESMWKTRTLDSITEQYLRDQVKHDLQEHLHDFIEYGADYDFFPVMIQQLKQFRFINIDQMNPPGAKTRKKREGKFWRWLLKGFPELNLERFMIFHQLDCMDDNVIALYKKSKSLMNQSKEATTKEEAKELMKQGKELKDKANKMRCRIVELINRDNCFVYACQQAGLSDDLVNELRCSIHKRSFGIADLTKKPKKKDKDGKVIGVEPSLCQRLNLKIHIREPGKSYYINKKGKIEVRLVLIHNHYMVDEKVNCSSYYIKHKKEIMKDKVAKFWSPEDKMRITGKDTRGYYQKDYRVEKFSLIKVIKALFKVGAFEPISMNEYRAYASLVCFENIDPIKTLEYDPRFCCRLKQDFSSKN